MCGSCIGAQIALDDSGSRTGPSKLSLPFVVDVVMERFEWTG